MAETQESKQRAYLDERKMLLDTALDYAKSYDKYLLTLSGGALVLSMTFMKDVIGADPARDTEYLAWGWGLLIVAIGMSLFAIHQTPHAHDAYLEILDEEALSSNPRWIERARARQRKLVRPYVIVVLSYVSMTGFLLGVGFLTIFAFNNIKLGAIVVVENSQIQKQTEIKAVPPLNEAIYGGRKPPLSPVSVAPPEEPVSIIVPTSLPTTSPTPPPTSNQSPGK